MSQFFEDRSDVERLDPPDRTDAFRGGPDDISVGKDRVAGEAVYLILEDLHAAADAEREAATRRAERELEEVAGRLQITMDDMTDLIRGVHWSELEMRK